MSWPYRLIMRGVQIERQREAAAHLMQLRLTAIADGMQQGREYVRGQDDPPLTGGEGYYDPRRYYGMSQALDRIANPWNYTLDKLIARRIAEEEADFEKFERDMGRMQA